MFKFAPLLAYTYAMHFVAQNVQDLHAALLKNLKVSTILIIDPFNRLATSAYLTLCTILPLDSSPSILNLLMKELIR
jgi:hypothetical protein